MRGHGEKLTRKQEQAVAALLSEIHRRNGRRVLRCGQVTLWRWLQDSDFQAAYRSARRSVVDAAVANLQQATRRGRD